MKDNHQNRKLSRRDFFAFLVPLLSLPVIGWWLLTGKRDVSAKNPDEDIIIGTELPSGITFYGNAVLVNTSNKARAYEAKCTHLGCKIKKAEGQELVCQCHGSRFDAMGKPVKGPASKTLRQLELVKDAMSGNYKILWDK